MRNRRIGAASLSMGRWKTAYPDRGELAVNSQYGVMRVQASLRQVRRCQMCEDTLRDHTMARGHHDDESNWCRGNRAEYCVRICWRRRLDRKPSERPEPVRHYRFFQTDGGRSTSSTSSCLHACSPPALADNKTCPQLSDSTNHDRCRATLSPSNRRNGAITRRGAVHGRRT
jgi:hypothetical protein